MDSRLTLSKNLTALRSRKNLTKEALAKKAGLSVRSIKYMEGTESGVTLYSLDLVAAALGTTASALLAPQ